MTQVAAAGAVALALFAGCGDSDSGGEPAPPDTVAPATAAASTPGQADRQAILDALESWCSSDEARKLAARAPEAQQKMLSVPGDPLEFTAADFTAAHAFVADKAAETAGIADAVAGVTPAPGAEDAYAKLKSGTRALATAYRKALAALDARDRQAFSDVQGLLSTANNLNEEGKHAVGWERCG